MDLPPSQDKESQPPEPDETQVALRCMRCGHEMAVRVVTEQILVGKAGGPRVVTRLAAAPRGSTGTPENSEPTPRPTTLDVVRYFWGGGPTWREYMIAGEQTIRLI